MGRIDFAVGLSLGASLALISPVDKFNISLVPRETEMTKTNKRKLSGNCYNTNDYKPIRESYVKLSDVVFHAYLRSYYTRVSLPHI